MQSCLKLRRVRRDAGFTLVELVIAMLVVGVLASIALPSFLGSRNNSYDKEAQASIELVLRAASALYSSQGDFSDAGSAGCGTDAAAGVSLAADLQKLQPNVDVVGGSVTSSNSRVVSVDARPTFNSNGEKLGCQAFYATVFSSSGSCFVARLTFEGKFLMDSSVSPIQVASQLNTQNVAVTTWSALAANGVAYAQIRSRSSGADADNTQTLALIRSNCKAQTQSTGSATAAAYYADPGNFYQSWRDTTTNPVTMPRTYIVGDTGPGGGTVFYVAPTGTTFTCGPTRAASCKYLEAAPSGWNTGADPERTWAQFTPVNYQSTSTSQGDLWANNTELGWGYYNTKAIIAQGNTNVATSAAALADSHTVTVSDVTYDDWFLPSKDELNQMCKWHRGITGVNLTSLTTICSGGTSNSGLGNTGFSTATNVNYSSASENTGNSYWVQYFVAGGQSSQTKNTSGVLVRAIRAFG